MNTIALLTQKMIAYPGSTPHDAAHLLKVWAYARTIGELESIEPAAQFILEAAALMHDIACPLCRAKYGHAAGPLQEQEGMPLARQCLMEFSLSEETVDRIVWLVGHHHTLSEIGGIDHQILIEADYLVNADEGQYSKEDIHQFCMQHFKTKTGLSLLQAVYADAY